MAVFVTAQPELRPWPSRSSRDPIGWWQKSVQAIGDATGGNIDIDIIMRAGNLYAVEMLWADSTAQELSRITLGTGDILSVAFTITLSAVPGIGGQANSILAEQTTPLVGYFFAPGPQGGQLRLTNVNAAGKTINFSAWGWLWDRDVLKTPGGPLRP